MVDFVHCPNCTNGYIIVDDTAKKCICLQEYQTKAHLEINLKKAGIEGFNLSFSNYYGKDIQKNIPKLKYYCENITTKFQKSSHLYLYGVNGTQKSTVSKIILKSAIEKNLKGKFILMNTLMDTICNPMPDSDELATINFLASCDLLVIDDCFSAKKVTLYKNSRDYQMSFLDAFFRKRFEQNKCNTIFTSNVTIQEIEKNGFSYDIQNLLEREIVRKDAQLTFSDVFVNEDTDINVNSLWS